MPYTDQTDASVSALILGRVTFTPPATYYLGLSTTLPSQNPAGFWGFTEPSSQGGYGRVAVANNATNFGPAQTQPAAGYQVTNLVQLAFAVSTGAWSSGSTALGWFGLFDSATLGAGTLWLFGQCSTPYVVNAALAQPTVQVHQFIQTVS
jgi:hypothetical protein